MQNEKAIEKLLVKLVKEKKGLCLKWVSPSMTGVPDRIVLCNSQIKLVELKDPQGKLSARQIFFLGQLEGIGIKVHVLASEEDVKQFVETL